MSSIATLLRERSDLLDEVGDRRRREYDALPLTSAGYRRGRARREAARVNPAEAGGRVRRGHGPGAKS